MAFLPRPSFAWKLRTQTLALGGQTRVMGIVNATPDSFSDGDRFRSAAEAIDCALRMFADGAAIVDIGGESTRPGARPVTPSEEADRVLPIIEGVLRQRPSAILSIDTYHAATAQAALRAGVEIVNDVSGLLWDHNMAPVVASSGCGLVLMHTRGRPEEWRNLPKLSPDEVMPLVKNELAERLSTAQAQGIQNQQIVLDPGLGFGKILAGNLRLLANLDQLRKLGRPLLIGASRKSFLGRTLAPLHGGVDADVHSRINASVAAAVIAIMTGADLVRAHDVRATAEAAAVADAVKHFH